MQAIGGTSGRRPLELSRLTNALADLGISEVYCEIHAESSSTNDDVWGIAPEKPLVLLTTDWQSAGHGRLGREWVSPAHSGIAMTLRLARNEIAADYLPVLPLVVALAAVKALHEHGVPAQVKWPNDLLIEQSGEWKKLGGILLSAGTDQIACGIGINVSLTVDELPTDVATSIELAGYHTVREDLIAWIAANVITYVQSGRAVAELLTELSDAMITLGQDVRIDNVDGTEILGHACALTEQGHLCVEVDGSVVEVSAGDVHHLRPHSGVNP